MFCIYLHVLLLSQRHSSCFRFGDLLSKDGGVVSYNGLDTRLVVHICG